MLATTLTLLALLQNSAPDTSVHAPPAPEVIASAYADSAARDLVQRVRQRRNEEERSIAGYDVMAKRRISVGMRALRRDRLVFREEVAARVQWRREGVGQVELLGARQVVPVALPAPEVPDDMPSDAYDLAFDPEGDELLQMFGGGDGDEQFIRHPLAEGSERDYVFGAGDTTRIRLSDGRTVRLVELRLRPRRNDPRLLRGSLWIDIDQDAPVRGVFRLARPVELERDLGEDDEDIPRVLKPIRADFRFLTVEYGLWEGRWWLPRLIAVEGEADLGGVARLPVLFEQRYEDFRIQGEGLAALPAVDTTDLKVRRSCKRGTCTRFVTRMAPDSVLLSSPYLPPSVYAPGEQLVTETELREMADVLGIAVPGARPWQAPEVRLSYLTPRLVRYNRVEGLALGARADADVGPLQLDLTAWLGTADLEPAVELGVRREGYGSGLRLAAYRRLATADPDARALGIGNSLSALLLGRDDGFYYRTLGAELAGRPLGAAPVELHWRLFAERQETAEKSTDLSLPRLWSGDAAFAENITAAPAEQAGVEARLRWTRGQNPVGVRWGVEAGALATAGTYRFVRPRASASVGFPLARGAVGAVEAAGGTTWGEAPPQSAWHLGGPATVRGYGAASAVRGAAFWRARAEVASAFPAARLAMFSDAGWAGEPADVALDPPLLSAGVGASLLDGLVRVDLSRALRAPRGWRMDIYLDGVL